MTNATDAPKRKRRRLIIACLECHRRRVKCDRGEPCLACVRHGVADACSYEGMGNDDEPKSGPSNSFESGKGMKSSKEDSISKLNSLPNFYGISNLDKYGDFPTSTLSFHPPLPTQSSSISSKPVSTSASSPNRFSVLKSSTGSGGNGGGGGGSSISPGNLVDDPSPVSSSGGSQQRSDVAPLARFLRQSQGEACLPPSETPSSMSNLSPQEINYVKRTRSSGEYTKEESARIRKACADWPPVSRIPNMIRFYFKDLTFFYDMFEEDEVNSFVSRRILPLLECRSDDEFYYRIRPGDATKLAVTSTILINAALRCSTGHLSLWSVARHPKERIPSDAYTAETRNATAARIKTSIRQLLSESIALDEPSYDQVRALIAFLETLKSEGTLAGTEALIWLPRLTRAAEEVNLLDDPPAEVEQEERERHRRLFVDFVASNWFGATMYGEHLRVPSSRLLTKFPQVYKNKAQEIKMIRFRMGALFEDISAINKDGKMNWRKVDDIDEELREHYRAMPEDLRPETAESRFQSYRTSLLSNHQSEGDDVRLQKHLVGIFYNFLRGLAHRTRFFPHPDIPEERIQHSRNICIKTAQDIIWLQQESRADTCSDVWLRGFHFVYITLEHAIVIVLAALTTLGDAETEQQNSMHSHTSKNWEGGPLEAAVKKARSLLEWGQRAADVLAGLPMDVSTNIQAHQFLQRLVSKAGNLIDWYESYARSSEGPRLAIFSAAAATKHLLSDHEGRPVHIPLLDEAIESSGPTEEDKRQQRNGEENNATLVLSNIPFQEPINPSFSHSSTSGTDGNLFNIDPSSITDLNYLGGLDNASFSLPRKDAEDPLSMFEAVPPLEEQIDVWLALLQQ